MIISRVAERRNARLAGVIDEDVDASIGPGRDFARKAGDSIRIKNVAAFGQHCTRFQRDKSRLCRRQPIGIAAADGDPCSFADQQSRRGKPDTRASTGHDRNSIRKAEVHVITSARCARWSLERRRAPFGFIAAC